MIRIQIADDHRLLRQGLVRILGAEADLTVIGEARDCGETLAMVEQERPDILLLDLSMPGRGGLDVLRQVRTRWPRLRVIVLTMHAEEQFAVRVMRMGAAGYVTKDSAGEELVHAIRAVCTRGKYVSARVAEQLAFDCDVSACRTRRETLSEREHEVLQAIAAGRALTDVAHSMALSVKTVSTYRTRVLRKLGLHSNADLVKHAIRSGVTA
jgi:DNA-binding NarL/FixJ family response regulator